MAALLLGRRYIRRERVFRDRSNPLDIYDDDGLIKRYRMDRPSILSLVDAIEGRLDRKTDRSFSIPATLQDEVLTALRFYATDSFQLLIADVHGISVATVSRCIHDVSEAIAHSNHPQLKFRFPQTPAERRTASEDFHKLAGFPKVIGCIDCTQIAIKSPTLNEAAYVCRKNFHSLNVQATNDAQLRFTSSVVAKYPGAAHDSFILGQSGVARRFQAGDFQDSILLGDSGYPLRPWLMIPYGQPGTLGERHYNKSLKTTRCSVERAFGVLKSRFRCRHHKSGGCLMYSEERCTTIIVATLKLHNFCISQNVPLGEYDPDDEDDEEEYEGTMNDGNGVRERIVMQRFSR